MLRRKHIKAPTKFDPGPQHATEHLAYLTPGEMEMLRVLTDGEISRGPRGIPSFAITTGKTVTQNSTPSSGPGGGSLQAPARTAPSMAASQTKNGSVGPTASSSRGPAASMAAAKASTPKPAAAPSATPSGSRSATPSRPATPAAPVARSSTTMAAKTALSPRLGGSAAPSPRPPATPVAPSIGRGPAASLAASKSSAEKARAAAAMAPVQKATYGQFRTQMENAPRLPEVPRVPGDAERMARMAMAESGIIRDAVTGKMKPAGVQAVMSVIRNRMQNQDETVGGVIGQRAQFSPWGDGLYSVTKPNPAYTALAESVLRGTVPDITKGADFYQNTATVKKNSGFEKASSETQDRIENNFREALSISDDFKPSVFGHQFGTSADGSKATRRKMGQQGVDPGGARDPAEAPQPPKALPSGIFGADPEKIGGIGYTNRTRAMPGRFGGFQPSLDGDITKISAEAPGPTPTYGALGMRGQYEHRFEDNTPYADKPVLDGRVPVTSYGLYRGGVPYAGFARNASGKMYDPTEQNDTGRRVYQAIADTALRTGTPVQFFSGNDARKNNKGNHTGYATDIRVLNPATGQPVGAETIGSRAWNPIGSVNPRAGRGPKEAAKVRAAIGGDYSDFANKVFDTLYQNPDAYGGIGPKTRFGGDFRDGVSAYDYMHFDATPGRGFSSAQTARHTAAAARRGEGSEGGLEYAGYSPQPMSGPAPTGTPKIASWSVPNALIKLGGLLSTPQNTGAIRDALKTGAGYIKQYAGTDGGIGLQRAIADALIENTVAPKVAEAVSGGMAGVQKAMRDAMAVPDGTGGFKETSDGPGGATTASYPYSGGNVGIPGGAKEGKKSASKSKYKGGEGGSKPVEGHGDDEWRKKKPKAAPAAAPEPAPTYTPPPPTFLTVEDRAAVMRRLLGEDWYA